jgi:hypothetical protein
MSPDSDGQEAVRRFGTAALSSGAGPAERPFRWLVAIAAGSSVLVACWLLAVTAWVLPSRDPAHVLPWQLVAGSLLAYSALSLAHVVGRLRWLGWILAPASVVAIAVGVVFIRNYASQARADGYILVMGLVIGAHGVLALLDGALRFAPRRAS